MAVVFPAIKCLFSIGSFSVNGVVNEQRQNYREAGVEEHCFVGCEEFTNGMPLRMLTGSIGNLPSVGG